MPVSRTRKPRTDHRSSISTRKAAKAIASPVRQELIDCIESIGPCTIAQVAQHTGRAPDSLYFHIRALQRAGLLVSVKMPKSLKSTGREPAMYDVCARPMTLHYREPIKPADLTAIARGMLRLAQRDIKGALSISHAGETVNLEGPQRQLWFARAKGWLLPEDQVKLNTLLAQALTLVRTRRQTSGAKSMSFVFAIAPSKVSERSQRP